MKTMVLDFAADHPTAAGHFPGNPIIPGAVLLDRAVEALAVNSATFYVVKAAKFTHQVRPGQAISLAWDPSQTGTIAFTCTLDDGTRVLAGSVAFETDPC